MTDAPQDAYLLFTERVRDLLSQGETLDREALASEFGVGSDEIDEWLANTEHLEAVMGAVLDFTEPDLSRPELPEDYELQDELGRGAMGIVYRVTQKSLDRTLALKVLRPGDLVLKEALQRFHREARSLARLKHPNIVPIHEVGKIGDHLYLTMDLVDGEPLSRRLQDGALSPTAAVRVARQIASAIAHAHGQGVVHRDLKPANVLLAADGNAHVVDFGLALDIATPDVSVTASGRLLGTPSYMSPEQARGATSEIGERSDVYALGAILYECLTGRMAFPQRNFGELIHAVIHKEPQAARELNQRIPRDLARIVRKAMAKDPEQRYGTMEALFNDLGAFEEGRPVAARDPGVLYTTTKWLARNRVSALYGATAATLVVGVLVLTILYVSRLAPERLIEKAQQLEIEGKKEEAEALREMAASLAIVSPPDPNAFPESEAAHLKQRTSQVREMVIAIDAEETDAETRAQALLQRLNDEADALRPKDHAWFEAHALRGRLLYALGRSEAGEDAFERALITFHPLHADSKTRFEGWLARTLLNSQDPERATAFGFLHRELGWPWRNFGCRELFSREPRLLTEFVVLWLRQGEWDVSKALTIGPSLRKEFHDLAHGGDLLPTLAALVGDSNESAQIRSRAAECLATIVNLPLGDMHFDVRPKLTTENDWQAVLDQYEAVKDLDWIEGLLARMRMASQETTRGRAWLWTHVGRRGAPSKGDWHKPTTIDELEARLRSRVQLDPKSERSEISQLLEAHRYGKSRRYVYALINLVLARQGKQSMPCCSRHTPLANLPWHELDGNGPWTLRVAQFDVSNPLELPILTWSASTLLHQGEPGQLQHFYRERVPFEASYFAPGFGFHVPGRPNRSFHVEAEVRHTAGHPWVFASRVSGGTPGGSWSTSGGPRLTLGFPGIIAGQNEPQTRRGSGSDHKLVLAYCDSGTANETWSAEEWRREIARCVESSSQLLVDYERRHEFTNALGSAFVQLMSAASYFPVPEARGAFERYANALPDEYWFKSLEPARLLANDPASLDGEGPDIGEEGTLGSQSGLHSAYYCRLLAHTDDPRIHEFALRQLQNTKVMPETRAALESLLESSSGPILSARLTEILESVSVQEPRKSAPGWFAGVVLGLVILGSIFSVRSVVSWRRPRPRILAGAVAVSAGMFLHPLQLAFQGWEVPTYAIGLAFLLIGSMTLALWGRRGGWVPVGFIVVAALCFAASRLAERPLLELVASFAIAVAFVWMALIDLRVPKGSRSDLITRITATLLYAVPALVLVVHFLWSFAAWGDVSATYSMFREVYPYLWFGAAMVCLHLLHAQVRVLFSGRVTKARAEGA